MIEITERNEELTKKNLSNEYSEKTIEEVGYSLGDITDTYKYSEKLEDLFKFYLERVTDPEDRKEGLKLLKKIHCSMMSLLLLDLDFRVKIYNDIKREVHGFSEGNIDKEKAEEIWEKLNEEREKLEELSKEVRNYKDRV